MPDTDGGDIPGGNGNLVPDGSNGADTPNTGYLTVDGSSNPDSSALSSNMLVLGVMSMIILVAITSLVIITRKHNIKFIFNRSKYASRGLIALALLVSVLSFIGLKDLNNSYNLASADDSSQQAEQGDTLAISTSDAKLDITLEDDPVYAYTKDTVTVSSPTEAGYTLSAYIDGDTKDLVNTTNSSLSSSEAESAKIVGLSTMSSQALVDNSWGIALTEPTSKDSTVFHGLPTNEDEALTLNVKGAATEANDTTDVYLGAYVVPGLPTGTYSGVTINYVAVANVVTDDITVKYHGNGLYFDEEQTKDENTVVYGNSCGMMYVGANCKKTYVGTQAEISKTPNVNDDGIADSGYAYNFIQTDPVTITGADMLKVELTYGIEENYDQLYIFEGNYDGPVEGGPMDAGQIATYTGGIEDYDAPFVPSGSDTLYINGDTVTFAFFGDDYEDNGYFGYYAKITPVYNNKPDGIETTETTICNLFKSDNIDDEGNKLVPYDTVETAGTNITESIVVPGADKVKVELTYGLTANTGYVVIGEGDINNPGTYEEIFPKDENLAGTKTLTFNGNKLFLTYELSSNTGESLPENYDYGFYAKIYPVYNEETDDSTPERVCSIINKSGEYMNTFGENNSYWYSQIDNPSNPGSTLEFAGESNVKNYLNQNYDEYNGQTIDLYATPNYTIHFDANGGEGEMADQIISGPYYFDAPTGFTELNFGGHLNYSNFSKKDSAGDYYVVARWNTEPDGSGVSYAPRELVTTIAKPGETITLYAQWGDCSKNSVCYHSNSPMVTGEMGQQTRTNEEHGSSITNDSSITLWASNFKRDGYGFAGWNNKKDMTGTDYGPNQTITAPEGIETDGLPLYAKWIKSAGSMQDFTNQQCQNMNINDVTALTDERDDNTYAIAKLADGKCWMIENLRLDDSVELSSTNTNNPSLPLTNIYDSNITSNHLSHSSSVAYDATTAPEGWCNINSSACIDQSRLKTDNTTLFTNNTSSSQSGNIYNYGNYYNWYSATAGHGTYDKTSNDTIGDICPSGWRLPTGGAVTADYSILDIAMGGTGAEQSYNSGIQQSAKWRSYPNNFVYSASWDRGRYGEYWTSSAGGNNGAYTLDFGPISYYSSFNPGTKYDNKYSDKVVRCVADV